MKATMNRRAALGYLGGAIIGGVTTRATSAAATWCAPPGAQMWSALGLSGNVTLPSGLVVLDVDPSISSLTIPVGSTLMFHPDQTRTLTSTGNIVVYGTLDCSPADATVVHKIHFDCPPESGYVGGGCDPVASDVGLWVEGLLKLNGTAKKSWSRLTAAATTGATSLLVESAAGWRVGDRLIVAPTNPVSSFHHTDYSDVTVTAVSGNTVSVTATQKPHPMSPPWNGTPLGAEVLNLSRNVIIEGAPTRRAHVMIHSQLPQTIRHAELRHLGPRKQLPDTNFTAVTGRYALHFHSCQDGSRGSVVEGVSAHTIGGSAFVPHASHGIAFNDCIAHEGFEALYWWDHGHVSSDITWERCVGSKVLPDVSYRGHRAAAFVLMVGTGNRVIDCVAVGVQGATDASGFHWPDVSSTTASMWESRGCVSHNNKIAGIFVWQNTGDDHFVSDQFIYNCPFGVRHGAYGNRYRYERLTVYAGLPVRSQAMSPLGPNPQRWVDCVFNATGPYGIDAPDHVAVDTIPVEFHRCTFSGQTVSVWRGVPGGVRPDKYDFVDCTMSGTRYVFQPGAPTDSVVRFQNGAVAEQATPTGGLVSIPPFFAGPLPSGAFTRGAEKAYTVICTI